MLSLSRRIGNQWPLAKRQLEHNIAALARQEIGQRRAGRPGADNRDIMLAEGLILAHRKSHKFKLLAAAQAA